MSKKKKAASEKNLAKTKGPQKIAASFSRFERVEGLFSRHRKKIFYSFCFLTALFSLLLFNIRISEGADDSTYVYGGYNYSKDFFHYFYTNSAPLYPLFLSIPIKLFGVKLILLKFISLIFYFFSFLFFFRALEKRIPYLVLIPAAFFYCISSFLQYYASQTYNEALFLLLQSLFIFYFFKLIEKINEEDRWSTIKHNGRSWLMIGLLAALLSLVKNLGMMIFPIVILYFFTRKQWRQAFISAFVLIGTRLSFDLLKYLIWGSRPQLAAQSETLFNKDPYNPARGTEDLLGIADRFIGNCKIFLSGRCKQIFGFENEFNRDVSGIITWCVIGLFVIGLIYTVKERNKFLLFTWLYVGALIFVSFIVLQHDWAQIRMIVIHIPLLLVVIGYAIYESVHRFRIGLFIYSSIFILLLGSAFMTSVKKIGSDFPVLVKNLKGDQYYGYTPDWVHFLKMSRWCADSLPENAVVVSRKAAMSFIYGNGKEFFPINRVLFYDPATNQADPDSVLMYCMQNNIRYFMLASIRFYPQKKTTETVNTLEVLLTAFHNKYPDKIVFIRSEGDKDDEPCYLYEIKY